MLSDASDVFLVAEANDRRQAVHYLQEIRPDVLLLAMNMPSSESIALARQLYETNSPVQVIVLTAFEEERFIFEMLAYGVAGYLTKEESTDVILDAIRGVADGVAGWLSPRLAVQIPQSSKRGSTEAGRLTRREREVLACVARGYTNQNIADELFISADTVKNHLTKIYAKLEARTRIEAVAWAWRNGLGYSSAPPPP